jgi:hypothetical protein
MKVAFRLDMRTSRSIIIGGSALVIAIALYCGADRYQKHAQHQATRDALHQKIDSLLQQASKLAAMTTQGVNFNDFNSQLASVHAEYDLLSNRWEQENWPRGQESMCSALTKWDLALGFWKRDRRLSESSYHLSTDPELLSFYINADPKLRAVVTKPGELEVAQVNTHGTRYERSEDKQVVNLSLATRVFMGDAADSFVESKTAIEKTE